jgi:hypothetical protein
MWWVTVFLLPSTFVAAPAQPASPPLTGDTTYGREQVTALLTPEHPDVAAKFKQRLDDSFVDDNRNVSAAPSRATHAAC